MSEKSPSQKRLNRTGGSLDSELADIRSQLSASEDTRHTLEVLAKQKVEEVTELQKKLHESEQRLKESRTAGLKRTEQLEKQIAELTRSQSDAERLKQEQEKKITVLESQLKSAVDKSNQLEADESSIRKELRIEKDRSEEISAEFQAKENENQRLSAQLQAAIRDLTMERENRSKTEESRRIAEVRIDELLAALEEVQITNEEEKYREREKNEDLWKQRTSYFYVAAISACATAAVVSIVFKNYTKS
eukprot:g7491.t1